jgi:hypothetical protein
VAVIKITNFGGLRPRVSPRALPDDGAQTANNLMPTTTEFRPLLDDSTTVANSGVNNPVTIYRLQHNADGSLNTDFATAGRWQISGVEKSFVKGQLNDDATERTYVTFNDASQAPRVIDATGEDRKLGVPAPTSALTVAVDTSGRFSPDDRTTALQAALQTALTAVRANVTPVWRGAPHPGTSVAGYVDATAANNFAVPNDQYMARAYRLSGVGGSVSNPYSTVPAANFSWIFDPLLGGSAGTAAASPAWAGGAGTPHWVLEFSAYGLTFDLDSAACTTALAAIPMPGMTDGTKLLTTAQVTEVVNKLVEVVDYNGADIKPKIDALSSQVTAIKTLLDGSATASIAATVQAFYSKTDVAAAITIAINNFALNVFQNADLVAKSSLPADYLGAGAAPE